MMQWMSTEKIGKADKVLRKGATMEELYFTIAGCSHYFGSDFMEWIQRRSSIASLQNLI